MAPQLSFSQTVGPAFERLNESEHEYQSLIDLQSDVNAVVGNTNRLIVTKSLGPINKFIQSEANCYDAGTQREFLFNLNTYLGQMGLTLLCPGTMKRAYLALEPCEGQARRSYVLMTQQQDGEYVQTASYERLPEFHIGCLSMNGAHKEPCWQHGLTKRKTFSGKAETLRGGR